MMERPVVLITGGAKRIGRALVLHLAKQGYRMVVQYHTSTAEAEELCSLGYDLKLVQADLRQSELLEDFFTRACSLYGRIDHVINNASVFPSVSLEQTDLQVFEQAMAVHSTAPFFLSKQLYLHVKQRGGTGSIINVLDTKLSSPTSSRPAYYCSKGALAMQTKALAVALAPMIRVNAISPGPVLSNGDDAYFSKMEQTLPLRRTGSALDICKAVSYLLEASFVTGTELCVDGGQRLL
jgi:NAD(P)-dependent dehydrogenase (short-subunit alcohol dehydrogenase family)